MDKTESRMIDILRVLCITWMMWVHLSPGESIPSVVNGGSYDLLGDVLINVFGRISVAALSFVSGYLFWSTGIHKGLRDVMRRLVFAIYAPMLFWSAIFILLAVAKVRFLGQPSAGLADVGPGWIDVLSAWSGILGPTANQSLFFVRDLIVSTFLLRAFAPVMRQLPMLVVAVALYLAVFRLAEPVLFRPSIFLFVVLGATAARSGVTLLRLSQPDIFLPAGLLLTLLAYLASRLFWSAPDYQTIADTLRRAGLAFLIFGFAGAIQRVWPNANFARISRHSFLAYLTHAITAGVVWSVWTRLVGGAGDASYLLYFIFTPAFAYFVAVRLGILLDRCPPVLQVLVRGRVFTSTGEKA